MCNGSKVLGYKKEAQKFNIKQKDTLYEDNFHTHYKLWNTITQVFGSYSFKIMRKSIGMKQKIDEYGKDVVGSDYLVNKNDEWPLMIQLLQVNNGMGLYN